MKALDRPAILPATIEAAFLAACRAEIDTLKPGNVHRFAPGHGMEAEKFEASAGASAPYIAASGMPVGARILAATRASWDAVGLNANLGIVLLCAPLAAAAERLQAGDGLADLRASIAFVLADLDRDPGRSDARDAFAAIALAAPGGLGSADEGDVRAPPTIGLVGAMKLAADRDLVARQYADGFAGIFDIGVPALRHPPFSPAICAEPGLGPPLAAYLAFATAFPDSHLGRKFGVATAEAVRKRFTALAEALDQAPEPQAAFTLALALDTALKAEGLNPGTSADLTVASLFACQLAEAASG